MYTNEKYDGGTDYNLISNDVKYREYSELKIPFLNRGMCQTNLRLMFGRP